MTSNDKRAAAESASQKSKLAAERKERLAAEMRENMKKRRAVSKSRAQSGSAPAPGPDEQSADQGGKTGE